MKSKIAGIAGLILVIVAMCGCDYLGKNGKEQVPEYVFTYAENQAEGYPTTVAAYRFAELVNQRSKGRIKINVFPGGELGDEVSVVEQLQYGGIDFARASIMTMGDLVPEMNILQLPYLYRGAEHMWAVLDGEIGQEFSLCLDNYGLTSLSWYDAGERNFYMTQEVSGLDDLKGKHIRVAKSKLMSSLITALGGIPIQMDYGEIYSALELGEIDGAENNWPSYESTDHYKVAPYMMMDGHNRIPELQMVSSITWKKLSAEDREMIRQCAQESSQYQQELWKQQEKDSRQKATNEGVMAIELSETEKQRFQDAVASIYEMYGEGYEELIQRIKEAAP